jgi:DNA-binding MarR family transcriptional regulator
MHEFPSGTDPLAARLFGAIVPLLKGSQNEVMSITAEFDLTLSQMRMLFVLDHADRPLAVNELAERVALSMAAAGRAVDHLHRTGIVSRREDSADRRIKRIELTELGTSAIAQISQARVQAAGRFVEGLTDSERDELDGAVTTLGRLMANHFSPPCEPGASPAQATTPSKETAA